MHRTLSVQSAAGRPSRFSLFALVCAIVTHCMLKPCAAWGCDGHKITAAIADKLLSASARRQVGEILVDQPSSSLSDTACWADEVKERAAYRWSETLHFVDTPDGMCNYSYERDCKEGRCAVGAIHNYTHRLLETEGDQRVEALKFLVHYVGDIHQPLHVAFTSDRGGNLQIIAWDSKNESLPIQRVQAGVFRKALVLGDPLALQTAPNLNLQTDADRNILHANLHEIWDTQMIKQEMQRLHLADFSVYSDLLIARLQNTWAANSTLWKKCENITSPDMPDASAERGHDVILEPRESRMESMEAMDHWWKRWTMSPFGCVDVWAEESITLACRYAYKDSDGEWLTGSRCTHEDSCPLGEVYFERSDSIVEQRLAQGGVRLAMMLNEVFSE
mmetsp:Transcript_5217/g.9047  ORF Transcript_5217/g.9047 Transcript_5217/m.9047 type:complete len:390 (+) Transcript_5217:163-1332(+)